MTGRKCGTLFVAVCLTVCAGERVAAARDEAQAEKLFREGETHYRLGRFAKALAAYEAAFEAAPLPEFLFNIGQCHRNLGHYDQAIFSYRSYLHEVPDADNRAAVEDLIVGLEKLKKQTHGPTVLPWAAGASLGLAFGALNARGGYDMKLGTAVAATLNLLVAPSAGVGLRFGVSWLDFPNAHHAWLGENVPAKALSIDAGISLRARLAPALTFVAGVGVIGTTFWFTDTGIDERTTGLMLGLRGEGVLTLTLGQRHDLSLSVGGRYYLPFVSGDAGNEDNDVVTGGGYLLATTLGYAYRF